MISAVITYARDMMNALGYSEWTGGFNYENIPATLFDTVYHVELEQFTGIKNNQDNQEIECPFIVRYFVNGGREPNVAIDATMVKADTIISKFLKASNRLTQANIKDIKFNNVSITSLNGTNDNSMILTLRFTAFVIISTR